MTDRRDDDFRIRTSAPKNRGKTQSQSFVSKVLKQAGKASGGKSAMRRPASAGGTGKHAGQRPGSRLGRGHTAARFAGAKLTPLSRRVTIKTLLVNQQRASPQSLAKHLRYIERDGVGRDGDPVSRLAPAALKKIHPLGKSPVVTDDDTVVAESGAIIEYLVERFGAQAPTELAQLEPARGTSEHRQCRFWMHYAEGSLMNWLVMQLVFDTIPRQPMPFFVRPIARALCGKVQQKLIHPNVQTALAFMEAHLAQHPWFAGEYLTMADFQMSFAVEAALARGGKQAAWPHLVAYRQRIQARPAYQRALDKGGPVLMQA